MSNQRPSLRKTKERWPTPIEVVYTTPIRNEPNRLKFIHEVLERRVRDAVKLGLYKALGRRFPSQESPHNKLEGRYLTSVVYHWRMTP
jgi:hypothetical protein